MNIHEFDLIFFHLANMEIPTKNGVLNILNHMVRPRNTQDQTHWHVSMQYENVFLLLTIGKRW